MNSVVGFFARIWCDTIGCNTTAMLNPFRQGYMTHAKWEEEPQMEQRSVHDAA